jgi:hypothetical protein
MSTSLSAAWIASVMSCETDGGHSEFSVKLRTSSRIHSSDPIRRAYYAGGLWSDPIGGPYPCAVAPFLQPGQGGSIAAVLRALSYVAVPKRGRR